VAAPAENLFVLHGLKTTLLLAEGRPFLGRRCRFLAFMYPCPATGEKLVTYIIVNRAFSLRCHYTIAFKAILDHLGCEEKDLRDKKAVKEILRNVSYFLRPQFGDDGKVTLTLPYYALRLTQ
jgi:hypothetical protein